MPDLETCTACGGQVARRAHTCPHCGQVNPSEWAQRDMRRGLAIGGVIFAVIAVAWTVFVAQCTVGAFGG